MATHKAHLIGWRSLAGAATFLLGMSLAAPPCAHAQAASANTAATDNLEEITVTGIRASIESAIKVKEQSNEIVEAISAEDIGKLPDTSIAESLSRLPGLTTQRSDGRDSDISIRGFGPDFNGTLMNGREQVSTGDNRGIQFDQYPAELIHQVVVYKTPEASLVGQGLAGTIDLQTTRPLEYGKRAVVLDARWIKNSNTDLGANADSSQYRASISYIDQFFDNTLGVTLGFARLDTPVDSKEVGLYDPWHTNSGEHATVPNDVHVTDGIKALASTGLDKRDGALATVEWKPTGSFVSTFDTYFTTREEDNNRRSMEANLGNYPNTTSYSNLDIVNGTLVGATVGNLVPLARNFLYITKDQIFAAGWNNAWHDDAWTVTGDLSFSHATRDEKDYETQATYQGGTTDTGTIFIPPASGPTFGLQNGYTDPSKVLVGNTIYGAGYSRFPHVVDQLKSVRVDVSRNLEGWFSSVAGGLNYDDRTKHKIQPEGGLNADADCPCQIASQYLLPATNLGFAGAPSALSWNVPAVLANYFQPIVTSTTGNSSLVGKTWDVFEKLSTAYIKGNLNHELSADVTLRGNVGVQFTHTQQESSSAYWNSTLNGGAGAAVPTSGGASYNDVLPSMNLVFQLPGQQDLRFGAAREVVHPRMDEMADSFEYGVDQVTGIPGASGGNPRLAPWRANALDLSYEKYFQNKAYVSLALFYKKLTSYIYSIGVPYDFSQLNAGLPPGYLGPGVVAEPDGIFNIFQNGQGGRVDGAELAVSLPGDLFTDYLTGFGVLASVSHTESSIRIPGSVASISSTDITLPGLSKNVWQVTAYYERFGFSARIATRYRSDYVGEITDYAGDRALEFVRHEQLTDFQTGYDFTQGHLSGLGFIFQIDNLTNTPFIDYANNQSQVRDYETYGRVYFLGAKYKF